MCVYVVEKERQTESYTDRQRKRQTERKGGRHGEKETDRESETDNSIQFYLIKCHDTIYRYIHIYCICIQSFRTYSDTEVSNIYVMIVMIQEKY